MEANSVLANIDVIAAAGGATLNLEHRASLPAALSLLQNEHNFVRVTLWGRILGEKQDYIIAQGFSPSPDDKRDRSKTASASPLLAEYFEVIKQMPKQTFRLSADGVTFVPVPPINDEITRKNREFSHSLHQKGQVFVPFTGDAATKSTYEFIIPPPPKPAGAAAAAAAATGDGEEGEGGAGGGGEEPQPTVEEREISEEERLSYVIDQIDHDTSVVPRGAFVLMSGSQIVQNVAFRGLAKHEARKLSSYFHFRKPFILPALTLPDRQFLNKSLDFLDSLSMDMPKGCWATHFDALNNSVVLRSLTWPGYTFFHGVETQRFGGFYSGTGERNLDIAFML